MLFVEWTKIRVEIMFAAHVLVCCVWATSIPYPQVLLVREKNTDCEVIKRPIWAECHTIWLNNDRLSVLARNLTETTSAQPMKKSPPRISFFLYNFLEQNSTHRELNCDMWPLECLELSYDAEKIMESGPPVNISSEGILDVLCNFMWISPNACKSNFSSKTIWAI